MNAEEIIELLKQYPKNIKVKIMDDMEGVMAGVVSHAEIDKDNNLVLHTKWEWLDE